MLISGRPVETGRDDTLGRDLFARALAHSLLAHRDKDSLVVGLTGPMGSGKSSLLNLIETELQDAAKYALDTERPVLLRFDPWCYADRGRLTVQFFQELKIALGNADFFPRRPRLLEQLHHYVGRCLGAASAPAPQGWRWWDKRRAVMTLPELKTELDYLFWNQPHKLVVTMDNVTRLGPRELRELFQIVKCLAEFPNTIYLLAFDRTTTIRTLNRIQDVPGEVFLDKVCQLTFAVPEITHEALEPWLFRQLDGVLGGSPSQGAWDPEAWAALYHGGLKPLFATVRDASRYLARVSLGYTWLKEEVFPTDFFAITAVEVFMPEVYAGIRENKDLFTDLLNPVFAGPAPDIRQERARCNEILGRTSRLAPEVLREFLSRLFPKLHVLYENRRYTPEDRRLWRKDHRICDADAFDRYFRLALPQGHFSEAEFRAVLTSVGDESALTDALLRFNQDRRIAPFLDKFEAWAPRGLARRDIAGVIRVLIHCGDLFPERSHGTTAIDAPRRVHRFCRLLLQRLKKAQRAPVLLEAIECAELSLYTPIYEILREEQTHDYFRGEALGRLKTAALDKIAAWAKSGRLINHPRLADILAAWQAWTHAAREDPFIVSLLQSNEDLLKFLCAMLRPEVDRFMVDFQRSPAWRTALERVDRFISVQAVTPRVRAIFEPPGYYRALTEQERVTVMLFLDCIEGDTPLK